MIHRVTGIPHGGTPVPKTLNSNDWIQAFTGGTSTKNSKGLLINRVTNLKVKWTCVIVSLCFTAVGQASYVKLTMLEPIGQILESGGVVQLGRALSCIDQKKLQGLPRKWSGHQVSILVNLAHHEPSHPIQGTYIHLKTDPNHGITIIFGTGAVGHLNPFH
jgi:hypothetical protein